jgi:hypothetical protein
MRSFGVRWFSATLPVALLAVPFACSGEDDAASGAGAGPWSAGGSAGAGADASADGLVLDSMLGDTGALDTSGCPSGQACGDGGICASGVCCEAARACAGVCCAAGQVCSFLQCVVPGATCADSDDCKPGEYCEYALGDPGPTGDAGADTAKPADAPSDAPIDADSGSSACVGGQAPQQGKCLPRPPICAGADAGAGDGGISCLEKCEYRPPTADFTPVVKLAWGGKTVSPWESDVMMTPVVVQLDDDDCDGKVTARDIPEIVFSTHSGGQYTSAGVLHAISVVGGKLVDKWAVPGVHPSGQLAAGNIDGKPGNEVVAVWMDGTVQAFSGDGKLVWKSPAVLAFEPAIADLDADGTPEVIVEGGILDGVTGKLEHAFAPPMLGTFLVSDLDGDGKLDVVSSTQAYRGDGTQFVDTGVTGHVWTGGNQLKSGPAIADLDKDGKPEVIAVYYLQHALAVWRFDPAQPGKFSYVRKAVDINGKLDPSLCPPGSAGSQWGGGPVTVADFNADGVPDVALAGGVGYAVFDGAKLADKNVADADTFLWVKQTHDCSSAGTGSSLFDFNGDGKSEVVYSDEYYLRIYEGATGKVLFETCNTTHTLNEYPVIADVDNDGQADIVVVSNAHNTSIQCNGTQQSGVRILGSASGSWVRTRGIWNQHAYHITNVQEDGTIPKVEVPNWKAPGLNNFRLNKQPGGEFAAPDAVVALAVRCSGPFGLVATVRNLGEAALPAGVPVTFWLGTPPGGTKLGQAATSVALHPAQAETVVLALPNAPPDLVAGKTPAYARVEPPASVHECRTANNTSQPVLAKCTAPR